MSICQWVQAGDLLADQRLAHNQSIIVATTEQPCISAISVRCDTRVKFLDRTNCDGFLRLPSSKKSTTAPPKAGPFFLIGFAGRAKKTILAGDDGSNVCARRTHAGILHRRGAEGE